MKQKKPKERNLNFPNRNAKVIKRLEQTNDIKKSKLSMRIFLFFFFFKQYYENKDSCLMRCCHQWTSELIS